MLLTFLNILKEKRKVTLILKSVYSDKQFVLPPGPIGHAEHVIKGSQEGNAGETINITSI